MAHFWLSLGDCRYSRALVQRWQPFAKPWVIAHRGASGLVPEHTLPGYALAIEQGADVIEPDLVLSGDGILHARHDLTLRRSTDIAERPEFAARCRHDEGRDDWWVSDFAAGELAQLRAIQPRPDRPMERSGAYRIPSFADVLLLLDQERRRRDRPLLVYPELKHPDYFAAQGMSMVHSLAKDLAAFGWGANAPVWVQCFDLKTLIEVKRMLGLRTTLLCTDLPLALVDGVDGYGIARTALDGGAQFIEAAHQRGQAIHAWTFRDDDETPGADPEETAFRAYGAGCDGLFGDFPATLWLARERAMR